jgi:nucleoside-diphosphate-sugar epimerase
MTARARHVFITGYPGLIAKPLLRKMLASDDQLIVTALVEPSRIDVAETELVRLGGLLGGGGDRRVRLISGDVTAMDLGLSGDEHRRLIGSVTEIFHLAAVHHLGVDRSTAERINVGGTQGVLDFASEVKGLERLVHFSSAFVCGKRSGVIEEDELEHGTGFRNPYEATKHQAEARVRAAAARMPVTIIRPSAVIGDSRTGEIERFEGVYSFLILLAASPAAIPIPLPGEGTAPLNLVPIDYLVDAVHAIAAQAETIGKTFHLVDPNPLSTRAVYELVARRAGRKAPRVHVAPQLTKALLRIPGLERWASTTHQAVDYLNHMAFFRSINTSEALEGTGIRCPRFESYADTLIEHVRRSMGALGS